MRVLPSVVTSSLVFGLACAAPNSEDDAGDSATSDTTDTTDTADTTGGIEFDEPTGVEQITAGYQHTCALLDNGRVRCWGYGAGNVLGHSICPDYDESCNPSLGDDEPASDTLDVPIDDARVTQITSGWSHTCALLDTGAVRCWGDGLRGQLGLSNLSTDAALGGSATQVVAGLWHTCALMEDGEVRCFGDADDGQLGYGNTQSVGTNQNPDLTQDVDVGGAVVELAAAFHHTCALLDTGGVRCWGFGMWGQLGYGNSANVGDNETPASVGDIELGGPAVAIAAGENTSCAIMADGTLRCWGINVDGTLGLGSSANVGDDETPASVPPIDLGGTPTQVSVQNAHACALLDSGDVRCWGTSLTAALGLGATQTVGQTDTPASAPVLDLGGAAVEVDAGYYHTCALMADASVRCWGGNYFGQLGYGDNDGMCDSIYPCDSGPACCYGDDEAPGAGGPVPIF